MMGGWGRPLAKDPIEVRRSQADDAEIAEAASGSRCGDAIGASLKAGSRYHQAASFAYFRSSDLDGLPAFWSA